MFKFTTVAEDPGFAAINEELIAMQDAFGASFKAEVEEYLTQKILLANGKPILQEGECWFPYGHDYQQFNDLDIDWSILRDFKLGKNFINLYGFNEHGKGLPPESALTTQVHIYDGGPDVMAALNSKRRNDVRRATELHIGKFRLTEERKTQHHIIDAILPYVVREWMVKPNSDGVCNALNEVLAWLAVKHSDKPIKMYYSQDLLTVAAFTMGDHGLWEYKVFHDQAMVRPGTPVRPPAGTAVLYNHLSSVVEATYLTTPSFMGGLEWPYESYKKKFSIAQEDVYSYFISNRDNEEALSPYLHFETWSPR